MVRGAGSMTPVAGSGWRPGRPLATRLAGVIALVVGIALTASACQPPWFSASGPAPSGALRTAGRPAASPAASARGTLLATVRKAAPRYAQPEGPSSGTVPVSWYGRQSVLPVIAARPGWIEVRTAQRPNGSVTWLAARDVALSATPYRIVISLSTTKLSLYDKGRLVLTAPAGVGAPGDPTPTGHFFVAFDEEPPQPNPGYGPFIMVTSAHSADISDWENSGDAVIGIHGPLGDDALIGTTGAKVSHGCIRLHEQALEQLAKVPAGTPIDVVR
jgi:lipoprotein-anchoring transpeptidase ErfK/SrfK